jgi:hypothetical protein
VIALFGCFYVVGRTFHSGAAAGGEPPSTQPLASAGVAIPSGLSGAPPIEENTALQLIASNSEPVTPKPRPASPSIRSTFKSVPETAHPVTAELPASAAPAVPSAPVTPVTQPAPVVTQKAPETGGGGASPRSSTGHTAPPAAPATGGEHSFDSSG